MNHQPDNPSSEITAINERVAAAVRSHRIKIRVLAGIAFLFGFAAIVTSIVLVMGYLYLVLPKQTEMLRDSGATMGKPRIDAAAGQLSMEDVVKKIDDFVLTETIMMHAISVGATVLAVAVGVLAMGTLTVLIVVMLNRRATLNQISVSLVQLSNQLRELSAAGGSKPPGP